MHSDNELIHSQFHHLKSSTQTTRACLVLASYPVPGSLKAGAERRAWYTLSAHVSNYAHDSLAL